MITRDTKVLGAVIAGALCLGFGSGWLLWAGKKAKVDDSGQGAVERDSLGTGFRKPGPVGRGQSSNSGSMLTSIRNDWSEGLAGQLMGYLRLVREAPVEDLIGLMKRMDREYPGDFPGDFVRNAIYKRLLGEDPEALLKATLESPTEGLMWRRGKIIDLMAERDFEGTMDKILEVRNQKHRTIFLGTLLSWRGREDFAEALRWCETIDDVDPYQLVGDLLEEVEAENAGEALDAMLASRHADVTDGIRSLFYKWSRHDRDAALAYVAKLRTHSQREKAIRGIAVRWAHEEPKVAREYAEGIESEQLRTVFLVSMLDTYGVKGAEALETVLAIPHLEKREGHLFPEFMKWSMENPTLAAEWAHEHGLEYLLERIPPTPRDNAIQGAVIDGLLEKIEIGGGEVIRGINTLGVFATAALGAGFALAWVCFGRAPGVAAVDSVPHEPETRGQNESAAPPIDFGGEKFEEVLQSSSEILRVGDVRGALEHLAENLDRDDFSEALLRMVVKLDGDQAEAMFKLFIGLIQSSDKDELSNLLSHVDDMVIIALMDRWMIQSGDEIFDYAFSGEIPEDEGDEVGPDIAMLAIAMLLPRDRERAMNVLHRLKTDWPEHFGSVEDMDFGLMAAGMSMRSTAEAIAWVKQEWPDTEDYEELFENGIRDPHATYDEIMKLEDSELREEVLQSFFAFWVKMDPVGVMGVTDKAGADWKGELVQRIVKELVKLDPQKGMRYAIETGNERTALKTWMGIDPDASVGWLLENGDETKRLILLQQHEEQLPLDAGLRLLDSLSEIPELERDGDGLLGRWARSDPRAALEWALKEGAYDFDYVGAFAASALYRDDPSAALAAYAGLADNALRSEFRDRLIYEMTNHDPDAAEPWLDTLQGEERENAMATYYRELAEHDPEAAFSGAIERGSLKGAEGVVQVWARHEEASHVYKWTREAMVDSEAIRKSVISAWARQDPLEASEAILLDAGENTGALVEELVNAWAGHDEEGAAWFINRRLEGDPMRDHALRGFAARVSIKSPNSPEEWRENFDDPAELQRVLDALGESGGSN